MNDKKGLSFYEVMALVAYGYFILIALVYFILSLYVLGEFSFVATIIILVFGIQAKMRYRVANLVLGVLTFAASIFITLECLSKVLKVGFSLFTGSMTSISVIGILLSLMLIFSYTKISFQDA